MLSSDRPKYPKHQVNNTKIMRTIDNRTLKCVCQDGRKDVLVNWEETWTLGRCWN